MHHLSVLVVAALAATSCAQQAQAPAPSPVLLTYAKSGVLPVIPTATPFSGVETIEGAITYDGPANPGFTGLLGDAQQQQNTPGASFTATLPAENFDPFTGSTVTGSLTATVPADGMGVQISVSFSGFPSEAAYGPFVYHIHALPIPATGNCTEALGHLDPTNRGEYYPCDATAPQTCQAGDLAGKHGNITGTSFTASYVDPYLSTNPASAYYIGGRSIVVHASNTTRLTCANLVAVPAGGMPNATTIVPGTGTVPAPTGSSSLMPYTGGAAAGAGAGAGLLVKVVWAAAGVGALAFAL